MMRPPAPTPRLPLDPGARPQYRPPSFGCSGVTLVSVGAVLAFLLLWVVFAPRVIDTIRGFSVTRALGLEAAATPTIPPGDPATFELATPPPTVPPVDLPPTPVPTDIPPTAVPAPAEYVAIGNSDGDNVALRAAPRSDAQKLVSLPPRTVLVVIGADVTADGKIWRNVQTTQGDVVAGWMQGQFLLAASAP